jgi:hypothetical protein
MLQLHDLAKADLDYQKSVPQQEFQFPPGSTWIVFSDQLLHAAMRGKAMMEQTIYLDPPPLVTARTRPRLCCRRCWASRCWRLEGGKYARSRSAGAGRCQRSSSFNIDSNRLP